MSNFWYLMIWDTSGRILILSTCMGFFNPKLQSVAVWICNDVILRPILPYRYEMIINWCDALAWLCPAAFMTHYIIYWQKIANVNGQIHPLVLEYQNILEDILSNSTILGCIQSLPKKMHLQVSSYFVPQYLISDLFLLCTSLQSF